MDKKKKKSEDVVEEMSVRKIRQGMFAKKDFVIHHNKFHLEIKEGDDLSSVPQMFIENLKTENVI